MLRAILGVIAGYIVMGLVVFLCMFTGYLVMGEEWAFKPGVFDVGLRWIALMLGSGLLAAVIGGLVCGLVSNHSKRAVQVLMGIVLVLGALSAVSIALTPEPAAEELVRTPPTPVLEAAAVARQPVWVAALNPIIGAVGVMLGATVVCPKHGPSAGKPEATPGDDAA